MSEPLPQLVDIDGIETPEPNFYNEFDPSQSNELEEQYAERRQALIDGIREARHNEVSIKQSWHAQEIEHADGSRSVIWNGQKIRSDGFDDGSQQQMRERGFMVYGEYNSGSVLVDSWLTQNGDRVTEYILFQFEDTPEKMTVDGESIIEDGLELYGQTDIAENKPWFIDFMSHDNRVSQTFESVRGEEMETSPDAVVVKTEQPVLSEARETDSAVSPPEREVAVEQIDSPQAVPIAREPAMDSENIAVVEQVVDYKVDEPENANSVGKIIKQEEGINPADKTALEVQILSPPDIKTPEAVITEADKPQMDARLDGTAEEGTAVKQNDRLQTDAPRIQRESYQPNVIPSSRASSTPDFALQASSGKTGVEDKSNRALQADLSAEVLAEEEALAKAGVFPAKPDFDRSTPSSRSRGELSRVAGWPARRSNDHDRLVSVMNRERPTQFEAREADPDDGPQVADISSEPVGSPEPHRDNIPVVDHAVEDELDGPKMADREDPTEEDRARRKPEARVVMNTEEWSAIEMTPILAASEEATAEERKTEVPIAGVSETPRAVSPPEREVAIAKTDKQQVDGGLDRPVESAETLQAKIDNLRPVDKPVIIEVRDVSTTIQGEIPLGEFLPNAPDVRQKIEDLLARPEAGEVVLLGETTPAGELIDATILRRKVVENTVTVIYEFRERSEENQPSSAANVRRAFEYFNWQVQETPTTPRLTLAIDDVDFETADKEDVGWQESSKRGLPASAAAAKDTAGLANQRALTA